MNLALAVTAAGNSHRFGSDKLLFPFKTSNLGEFCLSLYSTFCFSDKVVVLNSSSYELLSISQRYNYKAVINPNPDEGLSSSVRLAMKMIVSVSDPDGIMFAVADMPFTQHVSISKLICLFDKNPDSICLPSNNGVFTKPVIFPRRFYASLLETTGDIGGRNIIKSNLLSVKTIQVDQKETIDIDTIDDAKRWITLQH